MRNTTNRWQDAVLAAVTYDEPRSVDQILTTIEASGFAHRSKHPRATLGARIAELRAAGVLVREGKSLYRLARYCGEVQA